MTGVSDKQKLYSAPTSAGSVHEALKQRLDKYKSAEEEALKENNKSKAKRMGRIVKVAYSAETLTKLIQYNVCRLWKLYLNFHLLHLKKNNKPSRSSLYSFSSPQVDFIVGYLA